MTEPYASHDASEKEPAVLLLPTVAEVVQNLATYTVNKIGVTKIVCYSQIVCLLHAFYHKGSSKFTPCHIHCEPHRRHKSCLLITRFLPQMIFKIHTLPHTL